MSGSSGCRHFEEEDGLYDQQEEHQGHGVCFPGQGQEKYGDDAEPQRKCCQKFTAPFDPEVGQQDLCGAGGHQGKE